MAGFCDYLYFSRHVDVCYDIFGIRETICKCMVVGTGGAVTFLFTPALLVAIGFTSAGIVAGSIAAKLMSIFAIFNGGGVVAGGLVAFLQSIGATGLTATAAGAVGTFGGTLGWMLSRICEQCEQNQTQTEDFCPRGVICL
ncbi:interferon alpha-inducible protein 27-like protein 2A [Notolabrus celidotus]|uniref:interferon alpha-inducible protein 27-like protein 2A n=1 Tax=Notolabrus celidotus TaxID=1203425 RepID=UPI0014900A70|nr:interferon alpha-inducible protein 27-like protein 2A [Notolabrus celidotus]XP_034531228.1 interferon alpha-inducible protein 27-like protein 2A [Notolabrus celidotus]XP_034531229.1 interferon alpha-inducible protein 27-like protein 2A [Notolabrus celidotus]